MKPRIIAYYLPQFHPIKENDEWWGKGFTEWTNVAKAKPLFPGHHQPNIPADLGFYDLRLSESREAQAQMARDAGVFGFCYWHYWFGNGRQLLERPLNEVVASGKPDFPFCIGWANETWYAKTWNKNGGFHGQVLIEQQYPGEKDMCDHFHAILPILKDQRYIRVDGRPLLVIYRPLDMIDFPLLKKTWNDMLRKSGLGDAFFFVAYSIADKDNGNIKAMGFDGIDMVRNGAYRWNRQCARENWLRIAVYKAFHYPLRLRYATMIKYFVGEAERNSDTFPTIIPNWDHTPRSGRRGTVFEGVTAELFKKHVRQVLDVMEDKPNDRKIAFLKSWNEWGEGNYMEPDLRNGRMLIDALKQVMKQC